MFSTSINEDSDSHFIRLIWTMLMACVTYMYASCQGRPSPWGNDAFPSVSDFPLFQKTFLTPWKISQMLHFLKNFSIFIRQISDDLFLSHQPQISNSPIFAISIRFPPIKKTLLKMSPCFRQIYVFLHTLCVFRFLLLLPWCIYASHNARTGRPCLFFLLRLN